MQYVRGYPVSLLKDTGYQVIVYFYNPNIFPEEEYQKRLEAEKILCSHFDVELIEGEYNPQEFYDAAKGYEDEPEKGKRCDKCFELRLKKTAEYAQKSGIDKFTTSIVISPHKNYAKLTEIGERIAQEYGLEYIAIDFKKKDGFLKIKQDFKRNWNYTGRTIADASFQSENINIIYLHYDYFKKCYIIK